MTAPPDPESPASAPPHEPSARAQAEAIVEAFENDDLETSLTDEIEECLIAFRKVGWNAALAAQPPAQEPPEILPSAEDRFDATLDNGGVADHRLGIAAIERAYRDGQNSILAAQPTAPQPQTMESALATATARLSHGNYKTIPFTEADIPRGAAPQPGDDRTPVDYWKHEWLDLAASLDRLMIRAEDHKDRVRELIIQYANVLQSLLHADVNGGLEEEYADFPDAPKPDGSRATIPPPQPGDAERLARLHEEWGSAQENGIHAGRHIAFLLRLLDAAQSALAAQPPAPQPLDDLVAETERLGLYPWQGAPPQPGDAESLAHGLMLDAHEACGIYHTGIKGRVRHLLDAAQSALAESKVALANSVDRSAYDECDRQLAESRADAERLRSALAESQQTAKMRREDWLAATEERDRLQSALAVSRAEDEAARHDIERGLANLSSCEAEVDRLNSALAECQAERKLLAESHASNKILTDKLCESAGELAESQAEVARLTNENKHQQVALDGAAEIQNSQEGELRQQDSELARLRSPTATGEERPLGYTMHDMDIADALFTRGERTAIGWSDRADIAKAIAAARAGSADKAIEVLLYASPHSDGSTHYTCPALPGFHFIRAPGEGLEATMAALKQFISLYTAATEERDCLQSALAESQAEVARYKGLLVAAHEMFQEELARLRSPTATGEDTKEQLHQRFYLAFHDWFKSDESSCDFWSECDAPETLASIAVEIADRESTAARAQGERDGMERAALAARGGDHNECGHEPGYADGRLDAEAAIRALAATEPQEGTHHTPTATGEDQEWAKSILAAADGAWVQERGTDLRDTQQRFLGDALAAARAQGERDERELRMELVRNELRALRTERDAAYAQGERELMARAEEHYWDSLEAHKWIILAHLRALAVTAPEEGKL